MLVRFVHVARGPIIIDITNTYRRLRPGEFSAAYAHHKVVIERKAVPVTVLWSQSERRMSVDCLTFHPGASTVLPRAGAAAPQHLVTTVLAATDARQRRHFCTLRVPHSGSAPARGPARLARARRPTTRVRPHFHFLLVAAQEGTGRSWLAKSCAGVGRAACRRDDLHRLLDDRSTRVLGEDPDGRARGEGAGRGALQPPRPAQEPAHRHANHHQREARAALGRALLRADS